MYRQQFVLDNDCLVYNVCITTYYNVRIITLYKIILHNSQQIRWITIGHKKRTTIIHHRSKKYFTRRGPSMTVFHPTTKRNTLRIQKISSKQISMPLGTISIFKPTTISQLFTFKRLTSIRSILNSVQLGSSSVP